MWQRDEEEEADSGFVDEEGTAWELDPNDPSHPDYDLSEAAGYGAWEPAQGLSPLMRRLVVVASIVLLLAFLVPLLIRLLYG